MNLPVLGYDQVRSGVALERSARTTKKPGGHIVFRGRQRGCHACPPLREQQGGEPAAVPGGRTRTVRVLGAAEAGRGRLTADLRAVATARSSSRSVDGRRGTAPQASLLTAGGDKAECGLQTPSVITSMTSLQGKGCVHAVIAGNHVLFTPLRPQEQEDAKRDERHPDHVVAMDAVAPRKTRNDLVPAVWVEADHDRPQEDRSDCRSSTPHELSLVRLRHRRISLLHRQGARGPRPPASWASESSR